MLIIKKNQINNPIATVSMNKTLPNPYYLFSFQHIASKTRVSFIPETIISNTRYDKFRFKEGGNVNLSITPPEVYFEYLGQYYYSIYEQLSPTNTDIALAYNKLESGRAVVIVGDANPDACFFEPYISDDEDFANVIYMSEEEEYCISGDTTPECVLSMTGDCPTFVSRYSPSNSLYYKNTGDTANFISSFDTCAITQIAMDDSRMFLSDGCSDYYQFDYTISSGGCFSQTLVNKWDVWASSGATPNASYTMGIYDANNLIIGESAQYILQTGSTLYLYNLTTSGLTKWLEIGGGAQVSNVYYNTGNTQMITSYNIASGNTGFYALYSGAVNPQLVATIPVIYSNGGSTMYFSGNTPVAVNSAGLQYTLDFTAGTMNIVENSSGIPIFWVNFDDGFPYMGTIAQPASCYDFNICPSGSTTQYINGGIEGSGKLIRARLWSDSGYTVAANAVCRYPATFSFSGDMGTVMTNIPEDFPAGAHTDTYNATQDLQMGEIITGFTINSIYAECPCINLVLPQDNCTGYTICFTSSGQTFNDLCSNPQPIACLYSDQPFFTDQQKLYYDKCLTQYIDFNTYPMFLSTGGTQLYAYTFAGNGLSTYGFTCP
jgi:hypothetical protein